MRGHLLCSTQLLVGPLGLAPRGCARLPEALHLLTKVLRVVLAALELALQVAHVSLRTSTSMEPKQATTATREDPPIPKEP